MSTTTTAKVESTTTKKAKAPAASAGGGVTNLGPAFDPFATGNDPFAEERASGTPSVEAQVGKGDDKIHIRLQQRNGRKTVTTVQGIPTKYDPRKLLKVMKKDFGCIGHVANSVDSDDEEPAPGTKSSSAAFGQIIQFSGDQRIKTKDFLLANNIVKQKDAKNIVVHGY